MAKLGNPKHEEYALLLAKGVKQGQAYVKAGYTKNDGAASRLAKDPKIQDRVAELKNEVAVKIQEAIDAPTPDKWKTLKDMGIDMQWCAQQYKMIYEEAMTLGALPAANTAVQNIQKIVELQDRGDKEESSTGEGRIDINKMAETLLDKMPAIIQAVKSAPEDHPVPQMIDVTPEDSDV